MGEINSFNPIIECKEKITVAKRFKQNKDANFFLSKYSTNKYRAGVMDICLAIEPETFIESGISTRGILSNHNSLYSFDLYDKIKKYIKVEVKKR